MLSCVLILPSDQVATGNAISEAMGWGSPAYTVALSPTGTEPATHYGLHTWAQPEFVAMLQGAAQGQMPEGLDYPATDFAAVTGALIASVRDAMEGHFADVVAANGLQTLGVST